MYSACPCIEIKMAERVPWKGFSFFFLPLVTLFAEFHQYAEKDGNGKTQKTTWRSNHT